MNEQVTLTPLNARALLEQALLLDGKQPGEHVEALRQQFRRQVMGRTDRVEERGIRSRTRRVRGPAVTPRTRVRGPSRRPSLPERSDAEVLLAFDRAEGCILHARNYGRRVEKRRARNLNAIIDELRRRGLWVEVRNAAEG